jgi:hypothetical protein
LLFVGRQGHLGVRARGEKVAGDLAEALRAPGKKGERGRRVLTGGDGGIEGERREVRALGPAAEEAGPRRPMREKEGRERRAGPG